MAKLKSNKFSSEITQSIETWGKHQIGPEDSYWVFKYIIMFCTVLEKFCTKAF